MWELLYETFWDRLEHFCFNLCRDEAGGGSDPGSLSAGTAEPDPYQQLYRAAVQGLAVYHCTESLLRPTPPGGKGGAAAQRLFPGRGQC